MTILLAAVMIVMMGIGAFACLFAFSLIAAPEARKPGENRKSKR
jgi:hypothetical protein